MLKRVFSISVFRKLKILTMAEPSTQLIPNEGSGKKRPQDDDGSAAKKTKFEPAAPMQGRADRKRKVALLLAYCGAGYYGIQIQKNDGYKTIEGELISALRAAMLIPEEHAEVPQKMSFQRAARTDKNVSAVGNVISLKIMCEKINSHLPPEIRIIACLRTTKGFDSKNHCTARTYKYVLPTYSFAPFEKFVTKDYRLPDGSLQRVNEVLTNYVGTHNFHNFTSGKKPNDPSSKRYIISFDCGEPYVRDGIEFATLTVKGQSFMMHHIRKMIGLMISIIRGYCSEEVLSKSWGPLKLDIPKAPGFGLFLDELFFSGYNKKFGTDGIHEPLVWDKYQETLKQFKEERVLSHIVKCEVKDGIMLKWLGTLQFHKFDVIDPDQDIPPDGEKEKDKAWWRTRHLLQKLDKAKESGVNANDAVAAITEESARLISHSDTNLKEDVEPNSDQTVALATEDLITSEISSQDNSKQSELSGITGEIEKQGLTA